MQDWTPREHYTAEDLVEIIRILRDRENGCPWDKVQTHASIRKNFLEETCEALEAIDADDPVMMQEELGDVLMQVVFHTVIEEERGRFDMEKVCREVCEKLVFRHPNIFASSAAENAGINSWDALKNKEKGRTTLADELDTRLDEELHFAFDDRLGYLTQCPTNLGTGMRASLMLHLPALQERGALQQLANTVAKLGLTIRGLYGEGSRSEGAIYQLSNQVSLGISEQAAIENLKGIAAQIIREERAAREQLKKDSRFEDRVWRSLGILCTARLLTGDEFMALISNLRVGVSLGCLEGVNLDVIGGLINDVQPATLMADAGEELEPAQRDALRARIVRARLTPALTGQA